MMLNASDNLYRYQGDPPKIVPWLAESHTVSEDGLNWECKLRSGINCHDGSAMTADDVVDSCRRMLAPAGAFLKILKPEGVTAPEPLVVQINAPKIAYVQQDVVMRTLVIRRNNTKPPFNNLNARRCFAHAFNSMGFITERAEHGVGAVGGGKGRLNFLYN